MPRTQEYTERYRDALVALATATQRPANIVNLGGRYAIRVDFEYNRYALATNSEGGLSSDVDAVDHWRVALFQRGGSGSDELLVEVFHEWLADAFDLSLDELRLSGRWIDADIKYGELVREPSVGA